jgi:transcription termination factor Rho
MSVLDRSELQESPLADLHAIANQVGLDGFRRLRKAELIDAILGESGAGSDKRQDSGSPAKDPSKDAPGDGSSGRSDTPSSAAGSGARKRRAPRLRRAVRRRTHPQPGVIPRRHRPRLPLAAAA